VDARAADGKETASKGWGSRIDVGFACDETPELMPHPIMFAHRLGRELTRVRKAKEVTWLRRTQRVRSRFDVRRWKAGRIANVVVSTHTPTKRSIKSSRFNHQRNRSQGFPAEMLDKKQNF